MLIEFSVANYRSFQDEVTFSAVASSLRARKTELNEWNLFEAPGGINLLTSAAIYGANASGKSNFIAAFDFMREFVLKSLLSTERKGGIEAEPFRLSTLNHKEPSFFEVMFVVEGQRYRYGFEVTSERVEEEWLFVAPKARESRLFERTKDNILLGEKYKSEGRDLADKTRPNALFLSVVAQFDGVIAQKVISWFHSLEITAGLGDLEHGMRATTQNMLTDEEYAEDIKALVKQLDLGIEDIRMESEEEIFLDTIRENASEDLRNVFSSIESLLDSLEDGKARERTVVRTVHRKFGENGQPVADEIFDLDDDESEGTKKLFALSGPLVRTLKHGTVLVIDELDARLHPLLTKEIVSLFNDPVRNPQQAQLVFATQDTNLLDNQLLRRDQIWFVEKDRKGASHLYSLVEFKVRNDATFERDYIQGRYGAIPFLGGLRQVMLEQS